MAQSGQLEWRSVLVMVEGLLWLSRGCCRGETEEYRWEANMLQRRSPHGPVNNIVKLFCSLEAEQTDEGEYRGINRLRLRLVAAFGRWL